MPGATHGFSGLTYDGQWLYAARSVSDRRDEIVVFDRETLQPEGSILLPECYDVHQTDLFDGLLWITNTNYQEIVVLETRTRTMIGRHTLLPDVPEERALTESHRHPEADHRKRPHINSIMVSRGAVQIGLFGADRGSFQSSQILEARWERGRDGTVRFSPPWPLPVNGFRYPHNVHLRADGTVLGCGSAEGEFRYGTRVVPVGGWPRGIAVTPTNFYMTISSFSYGLSKSEAKNHQSESNAAVVRIDRTTMQVTDRFEFDRIGQLYEVRLAEEVDYGMSEHATLNPLHLRARRRAA